MKRTSLMLLLIACFISCKKDKNAKNTCDEVIAVEPAIIGKWRLVEWGSGHYNTAICAPNGSSYYIASDLGTNVVLEIRPKGNFRTYKNDTLLSEYFATSRKAWNDNYGEQYFVSCGQLSIRFLNINQQTDSLHNIQIGDTLRIDNPFIDLNTAIGPTLSITWMNQYYVKIE